MYRRRVTAPDVDSTPAYELRGCYTILAYYIIEGIPVQIEISDEDAQALAPCVEMLILQHEHAKVHSLECPSVDSPEMLTEVVADYDQTLVALRRLQLELGSASV